MESAPVIFKDLVPLFRVARFMLVLPFKNFNLVNYDLVMSRRSNLLVAAAQTTINCAYFIYMILALGQFSRHYGTVEETSAAMSFTIMIVLLFFDAVNVIIIMLFCLRACKYVNLYLRMLQRADGILKTPSQRAITSIHMRIFVSYYLFKLCLSVFKLDAGIVTKRIGTRFVAGIIMCTEQMLLVFCLQLSRRVARLNSILRELAHTCNSRQIREVQSSFLCILSALGAMTDNIGPYLFFNLTQLFLMALCSLLFILHSCGHAEKFENIISPMHGECSGRTIAFLEAILRFWLIIIACSKPANLVRNINYSFESALIKCYYFSDQTNARFSEKIIKA
jgi:hypothetical protein